MPAPPPPDPAQRARPTPRAPWFRLALGIAGLAALVLLVRHVGVDRVAQTMLPALRWLPALCALEAARIGCETLASALAFGALAARIPRATLYRAHVIGQSLGTLAPAPRVVTESIKVGLLAPYVGAAAAASVGFVNQAATLIAVGIFSVPCGVAILAIGRAEPGAHAAAWFWAAIAHAVLMVSSGVALQAVTRADAPSRWLVRWLTRALPPLAARAAAFRVATREQVQITGLWATGPSSALAVGRCVQVVQLGVAAHAVGIDAGALRAMAAEGVNLLAAAVGVLVPAGLGSTDGAFTLAADMLGTTTVRATALALLLRCLQLTWVLIASVLALFGRAPRSESR